MAVHDVDFFREQAARLVEHLVGDADLADVVQQRGDFELVARFGVELHDRGPRAAAQVQREVNERRSGRACSAVPCGVRWRFRSERWTSLVSWEAVRGGVAERPPTAAASSSEWSRASTSADGLIGDGDAAPGMTMGTSTATPSEAKISGLWDSAMGSDGTRPSARPVIYTSNTSAGQVPVGSLGRRTYVFVLNSQQDIGRRCAVSKATNARQAGLWPDTVRQDRTSRRNPAGGANKSFCSR